MAVNMLQGARATTARRCVIRTRATQKPVAASKQADVQAQVCKAAALSAVAGNMLMAGQASAAAEVATIAADTRVGILAFLFLPVVGWVLFNIFGPAKNQFDNMSKSVVVGAGLSAAAMLAAESADAAQEVATTAGDSRLGILAFLFLPVVGWVGFNILGPASNQFKNMSNK